MDKICPTLFAGALCCASPAHAQSDAPAPVTLSATYTVDAVTVAKGAGGARSYVLHDVEAEAGFDFDRLIGASGLTGGVHLLATAGGAANNAAGTLQGINNIEVAEHRAKLYEAWLEQSLAGGRVSLRLGLSDLNAEFYQNDAAGLLIAPAFGIGSELAATGPNGPSIFPSTALTARVNVQLGKRGYFRVAAVNAHAGVLGDPNGVDFSMRDGALLIAEGGTMMGGKLALGVWRYTRRQDDYRATTPLGEPVKRVAAGGYLLVDQKIAGGEDRSTHLFLRAGLSEGRTTPFRGGFQAGLLMQGVLPGRPDGQFSIGLQHGLLTDCYRAAMLDAGVATDDGEMGLEITYQDRLTRFLSIQPDIQYIRRADRTGGSRATIVFGLRLIAEIGG
ncbi:carbohydrate porin [Sphingomonas hengshuiensis]|uniref:Porin n=1 Tax=Sphingomonas hengshuiensis TaxID=1609977 RepID=A0A7U4LFI0_9SPHN|nr:carbohydrate porin [Sphingomonas hengshuiensis]AJP72179.1 porin [Sphingomonas hengshuiensis]